MASDTPHDSGYKQLFSHPDMVRDLLTGFVPGPWLQAARFDTLERVNASYVSESDKQRHDDMVWRLQVGPRWVWIYLLLEFQSQDDPWMAVRMMVYVGLLAQHLIREKQLDQGQLPALIPLVLYNGPQPWKAPIDVSDCFAPSLPGLARFRPRLMYHLIDEARLHLSPSHDIRNVVEALFKLERSTGPADMIELIKAAGKALQAPEQKALRRTFDLWFRRLIRRKMPQTAEADLAAIPNLFEGAPMLEHTLERIFKQAHKDGLHDGLKAGREEGITLMLRRVLEQRFSTLPPWVDQRLNEATPQQLDQWSQHMLSAPSLEALLNRTEG
jgi:hypothetical protein